MQNIFYENSIHKDSDLAIIQKFKLITSVY